MLRSVLNRKLIFGLPHGSVRGPILFNIYLNDLLLSFDGIDIFTYADDTTRYTCDQNLQIILERLENVSLEESGYLSSQQH